MAFAALLLVGQVQVTAAPTAVAADDVPVTQAVECRSSASIYARVNGGDLRLYQHNDPGAGASEWGAVKLIEPGWGGVTFAGPGNVVYSLVSGELRRLQYNGSGWDQVGGQNYEVVYPIGFGWDAAPYNNRISADSRGDVYRVGSDGVLKWLRWDPVAKTTATREIESGWNRFDLVVAAGDGVLYARDPSLNGGNLYRFQYDVSGQRWIQRDLSVGVGWNLHAGVFSPGADILYGHTKDPGGHGPGELFWYRHNQKGFEIGTRTYLGWGWGNGRDWDVTASTDTCVLVPANASPVRCTATVPIAARIGGGDVRQYFHDDPITGSANWTPEKRIAVGWTGRVLAGPDGLVYNIMGNGELRRFRWNGTAFDVVDGAEFQTIDTGWIGYEELFFRNRVTIDAEGDFYTLQHDEKLRWKRYNTTTKKWDVRVIDTGMGRFDLIVAAGKGVIYARDPSVDGGRLYRFHYDAASQRLTQREQFVSSGWNKYGGVFSPGADILYSRTAGVGENGNTGELNWMRFDQNGHTTAGRKYLGWGWGNGPDWDVSAAPNTCELTNSTTPVRPAVAATSNGRQSIVQVTDGSIAHSYVNAAGALVHGKQRSVSDIRSVSWTVAPGYQSFTASPASVELSDGRLQVLAHGRDSEIRSDRTTTKDGPWAGLAAAGGFTAAAPVTVKDSAGRAVSFAVDGDGVLWSRTQDGTDNDLTAWKRLGGQNLAALPPTVVRVGDVLRIVALGRDGVHRTANYTGGALGTWTGLGGANWVGEASVVALASGALQVFARGADNLIHTQVEGAAGFTGSWTALPDIIAGGTPSALLTPQGNVEVVVRDANGQVRSSGTVAPGATAFRDWSLAGTDEAATDLAVLAMSNGTWVLVFRDSKGVNYLYQDISSQQPTATQRSAAPTAPVFERYVLD